MNAIQRSCSSHLDSNASSFAYVKTDIFSGSKLTKHDCNAHWSLGVYLSRNTFSEKSGECSQKDSKRFHLQLTWLLSKVFVIFVAKHVFVQRDRKIIQQIQIYFELEKWSESVFGADLSLQR